MASYRTLKRPNKRIVSFRIAAEGDGIRAEPLEHVSPRSRFVILVHGFNVSETDAFDSYKAFERRVDGELGRERGPRFREDVLWLLWPGDTRIFEQGRLLALAKPLIYGPRVRHVQEWANHLADWLSTLRQPDGNHSKIVFVGHSLGCRAILEALRILADRGGAETYFPFLLLMAAAIPVVHLQPEGDLRRGALLVPEREVLHSTRDLVLQAAFRGGQHFGEFLVGGPLPEAVGVRGAPFSVWTDGRGLGIGHSDYWDHPESARRLLRGLGLISSSRGRARSLSERPPLPTFVTSPDRVFKER